MSNALLAIAIGGKFLRGLLGIWLKDKAILNESASAGVEFFEKHTKDFLEARKSKRFFEELADRVTADLARFIDNEHKTLLKGDIQQIVDGSVTIISSTAFFDLCLRERLDYGRIIQQSQPLATKEAQSRAVPGEHFYSIFRFIVLEFLSSISALPTFNRTAFRHILEDTELIIEKISRMQESLDSLSVVPDDDELRQDAEYRSHFARHAFKRFNCLELMRAHC